MAPPDLSAAAAAIEAFLRAVGAPVDEDPELAGTGQRVAEAYVDDLLAGYRMDPAEILAESTASTAPGWVLLRSVATSTTCPHHLMPASGVAHLGYRPRERVVGLGALARLVDAFAHRLVLQEDLGQCIADALVAHLDAYGAGVVLDLAPTCMTARGERRHGARAVTTAFAGSAAVDPSERAEFLSALAVTTPHHDRTSKP
ncbi:MAG: GTP cyclohydrolase I [Sandaracinaceae bacterium]